MKYLIFSLSILALIFSAACNDDQCDDAPSFEQCSEHPDKDATTCMAYWESWIYDESTGECEKMGYSGCEPLGFETKEECDKCDCYRLEGSE